MFNKDIEKLNFIVENISNIEEIIKRHDGIVNALKDKVEARPAILMAFLQIGETLNKLQNTYETLNIDAIKESFENSSIFFFIKKTLPYYINFLQDIRNEVVHGSIASKDEANTLRNKILGVADDSILTDILKYKKKILESRT